MKKFLTLTTLALALASAAAWAQEQAPFKFEDYKERTAFTEAIATRFPVGSSYLTFKKQVIAAGARTSQNILDNLQGNSYTFTKSERPGVATMIVHNWAIAVTTSGDTITAITPTLSIGSNDQGEE